MNHALRRVSLACLVMFLLLLVNANYVQGFETGKLASGPGNGRTFALQYQYQRGAIITADNQPIAESKHIPGVYSFQRTYPSGQVYAPVTGYDTPYSKTGIEQAEDRLLAGTDPRLAVRNLIDLVTGKPRRGATVQLTINSAAQQAAYKALKATKLPSGAVAIDPSTGAILALASYPTFNPNKYATLNGTQLNKTDQRYRNSKQQPLLNRAINETFPPGSTFKIVTSSTAFSTGKYNPDSRYYAPTNLKLPGTTNQLINFDNLPCDDGSNPSGNGTVPLIYAFTVSCNTVFGGLGMHLGGAALRQQANSFGMNRPLRIPLPVSPSNYPPVSNPDFTAYSAIGQYNDTVTPLQEAMFAAAIANHGTLMRPYMVQKVIAPNLTPLVTAQPSVLSQTVSPAVASDVARMMTGVVAQPYGTAHSIQAELGGITVAAKTGTAQNGANNTGLDDAVFTCFAPVGNPRIAVGVVVKGGGLGADASAPVAVQIIKAYMSYLNSSAKR
jgi:cell division protein FtsI/penicillin-binding protein 2